MLYFRGGPCQRCPATCWCHGLLQQGEDCLDVGRQPMLQTIELPGNNNPLSAAPQSSHLYDVTANNTFQSALSLLLIVLYFHGKFSRRPLYLDLSLFPWMFSQITSCWPGYQPDTDCKYYQSKSEYYQLGMRIWSVRYQCY